MKRSPFGKRLLLGLTAVTLLATACGGEPVDEIPDVEKVEWTIEVSEYAPSPGTVTLKGDVPLGFPTETWKGDVLLARTVDARAFEWNMDVSPEVPIPVHESDEAGDGDDAERQQEQPHQRAGAAHQLVDEAKDDAQPVEW